MSSGLIATKIGMSRVFQENGDAVAVTYLKVEPNVIIRTKTADKDGYNAIVLGIRPRTWKSRKGVDRVKYAVEKEWRVDSLDGFAPGGQVTMDVFTTESQVRVTGISKGKGFQGVMKRHGFAGGPATHGSHFKREPGSVGMREWPGRVLKGKRMAGRMGGDTVTLETIPVLVCDAKNGIIGVRGPVPGPAGAPVYITIES